MPADLAGADSEVVVEVRLRAALPMDAINVGKALLPPCFQKRLPLLHDDIRSPISSLLLRDVARERIGVDDQLGLGHCRWVTAVQEPNQEVIFFHICFPEELYLNHLMSCHEPVGHSSNHFYLRDLLSKRQEKDVLNRELRARPDIRVEDLVAGFILVRQFKEDLVRPIDDPPGQQGMERRG